MTGAARHATAQGVFWEWVATYSEPRARANDYKRRGKKAEFYRRVDRRPRRRFTDAARSYETTYSCVRTINGRDTDRAVALICGLDLPDAAGQLGKATGELLVLDHDPLPPDYYYGDS